MNVKPVGPVVFSSASVVNLMLLFFRVSPMSDLFGDAVLAMTGLARDEI